MRPRSPVIAVSALPALGVLQFTGPDAGKFLQGQLSNDLGRCDDSLTLLAGLHNPQGRVLALLRLARTGEQQFSAVLPRDLLPAIATHLRRFVLRARVTVGESPAGLAVAGQWHADGARTLLLVDAPTPSDADRVRRWHLADIEAGLPQVYASSSGQFLAQQINLDQLDAIAFDKGCYTGQEIIARAHYRGQVRRRMERLTLPAAALPAGTLPAGALPAPGAELLSPADGTGHKYRVVDAEVADDGSLAVLAVPTQAAAQSD